MNEQQKRLSLPLDDLELVVLKGILSGVLQTYETNPALSRDPDNPPYLLLQGLSARLEDIFEREVKPRTD